MEGNTGVVSNILDEGGGVSVVYYDDDKYSFPVSSEKIAEIGLTQGAELYFTPMDGQGQRVYYNSLWVTTIL